MSLITSVAHLAFGPDKVCGVLVRADCSMGPLFGTKYAARKMLSEELSVGRITPEEAKAAESEIDNSNMISANDDIDLLMSNIAESFDALAEAVEAIRQAEGAMSRSEPTSYPH